MPVVLVTANRGLSGLDETILVQLGHWLRLWVAEALTCDHPDGHLTPPDVEVEIKERHTRFSIGGEKYDLQITVWANDFPSRKANLKERCHEVQGRVRDWCAGRWKGYVWILLAPAAFEEF